MNYEYLNQFNMTDELSHVISSIISKIENEEYVCKVFNCSIPKHKKKITTQQKEKNCKRDYKKQNIYYVSKQNYKYLIVIKKEKVKELENKVFKEKVEMQNTLDDFCTINTEYFGIFDSSIFYKEFPYLKTFFTYIDNWRSKTMRVTIDENILEKSLTKTLKRK